MVRPRVPSKTRTPRAQAQGVDRFLAESLLCLLRRSSASLRNLRSDCKQPNDRRSLVTTRRLRTVAPTYKSRDSRWLRRALCARLETPQPGAGTHLGARAAAVSTSSTNGWASPSLTLGADHRSSSLSRCPQPALGLTQARRLRRSRQARPTGGP